MIAVPLAFLAVFFVYPVVTIIGRGLWPDGELDLSPIADVFGDAALREVAWFTVWQAALSTLLTLAVGLPAAYALTRFRFRGASLVRSLVVVPFVLPTLVVGSAFLALGFGPSVGTILVAHLFFNYAVVVRTVGGLWGHLDPHQEDAARVLGASRVRAFTSVTLPALRPAIARGRGDRLPVHVHVVRGDPRARRTDALDARDRDLPADHAAPRPPDGGGALDHPARRRARAPRRHRAAGRTPRDHAHVAQRRDDRAAGSHRRGARLPGHEPGARRDAARRTDPRAGRTVVRHARTASGSTTTRHSASCAPAACCSCHPKRRS